MSQRLDRVDELLRQEIGAILEREVSDPRIGFVTVTRVETSPDLAHSRVWVSVIGTPEERTESIRALERAMPYVRRRLGGRIRIRRIPALSVHRDESIERGARVLKLIDEIEAGMGVDALASEVDAEPTESLPTPTRRRAQADDAPDVAEAVADPAGTDPAGPAAATQAKRRGTRPPGTARAGGRSGAKGSTRGGSPSTRRRS